MNNPSNRMRVVVMGGSGFIGQACAQAFSLEGHDVIRVGRGNELIHKASAYKQCNFQADELGLIFSEFGPDLCVNAAGSGNPSASVANPALDFEANTALVHRILDGLRQVAPKCRYIGLSSAAIYGNSPDFPTSEDSPPAPCSPYGYHKLCAELITKAYHDLYGMRTLSIRAFSVYGPGLRKQLFWDLFQRTKSSRKIVLFGTGNETRDYIFIDDLAHGITRLAANAEFVGECLNLGGGRPTTVAEACGILLSELECIAEHSFMGEELPGSPLRMEADISRSLALDYVPRTELRDGLRKTAEWLRRLDEHA